MPILRSVQFCHARVFHTRVSIFRCFLCTRFPCPGVRVRVFHDAFCRRPNKLWRHVCWSVVVSVGAFVNVTYIFSLQISIKCADNIVISSNHVVHLDPPGHDAKTMAVPYSPGNRSIQDEAKTCVIKHANRRVENFIGSPARLHGCKFPPDWKYYGICW